MKQAGISGDYLEWKRQREDFERAQRLHMTGDFARMSEPMVIEKTSALKRLRSWFFTPRGALVYFGIGWAGIIVWLIWIGHQ
jgi:hypothetical protein